MGRFGERSCEAGTVLGVSWIARFVVTGIRGVGGFEIDADSGRDPFSVNISCRLRGSQGSGSQKYKFQLDSFVVVSDG
jgi:hypothetical protein